MTENLARAQGADAMRKVGTAMAGAVTAMNQLGKAHDLSMRRLAAGLRANPGLRRMSQIEAARYGR